MIDSLDIYRDQVVNCLDDNFNYLPIKNPKYYLTNEEVDRFNVLLGLKYGCSPQPIYFNQHPKIVDSRQNDFLAQILFAGTLCGIGHFVGIVYNPVDNVIEYYDSTLDSTYSVHPDFKNYLKALFPNTNTIRFFTVQRQSNGIDCALHAMVNLLARMNNEYNVNVPQHLLRPYVYHILKHKSLILPGQYAIPTDSNLNPVAEIANHQTEFIEAQPGLSGMSSAASTTMDSVDMVDPVDFAYLPDHFKNAYFFYMHESKKYIDPVDFMKIYVPKLTNQTPTCAFIEVDSGRDTISPIEEDFLGFTNEEVELNGLDGFLDIFEPINKFNIPGYNPFCAYVNINSRDSNAFYLLKVMKAYNPRVIGLLEHTKYNGSTYKIKINNYKSFLDNNNTSIFVYDKIFTESIEFDLFDLDYPQYTASKIYAHEWKENIMYVTSYSEPDALAYEELIPYYRNLLLSIKATYLKFILTVDMNLQSLLIDGCSSRSLIGDKMHNLITNEMGLCILPKDKFVTRNNNFSTYKSGSCRNSKIDWVIVSPELVDRVIVEILPLFPHMGHKFMIIHLKELYGEVNIPVVPIENEIPTNTRPYFKCPQPACVTISLCKRYLKRSGHTLLNHRVFKCDLCDIDFFQQADLNCHIKHHERLHPEWTVKCDECFFTCNLIWELNIHKKKVHDDMNVAINCKCCLKPFKSRFKFMRHYQRMHMIESQYTCNLCKRSFRYFGAIKEHSCI